MKKKILQYFANAIIEKIRIAKDEDEIKFYYDLGMSLNSLSLDWEIELE